MLPQINTLDLSSITGSELDDKVETNSLRSPMPRDKTLYRSIAFKDSSQVRDSTINDSEDDTVERLTPRISLKQGTFHQTIQTTDFRHNHGSLTSRHLNKNSRVKKESSEKIKHVDEKQAALKHLNMTAQASKGEAL